MANPSLEITKNFLIAAHRDGTGRTPGPKKIPELTWQTHINLTLVYFFSPISITLEKVAGAYRIKPTTALTARNRVIRYFHANASPETQTLFPLENIKLKKPLPKPSGQVMAERLGIDQMLNEGKNLAEIRALLNIDSRALWRYCETLNRRYGTDLAQVGKRYKLAKECLGRLENGDPTAAQLALDTLPIRSCTDHAQGNRAVLTTLAAVLKGLRLPPLSHAEDTDYVYACLRSSGLLPVRLASWVVNLKGKRVSKRSVVIPTKYRPLAIQAINTIPELVSFFGQHPYPAHPVRETLCQSPSTEVQTQRLDHMSVNTFFIDLHNQHEKEIYVFLLRLTHDPEEAKDLTQEVFKKAYEKLPEMIDRGNFRARPWLYRIAKHAGIDELRRKAIRQPSEDFHPWYNPCSTKGAVENIVFQKETQTEVRQVLGRLPRRFREILVLRICERLSRPEIAQITGFSLSETKTHLNSAQEAFRRIYVQLYPGLVTTSSGPRVLPKRMRNQYREPQANPNLSLQ